MLLGVCGIKASFGHYSLLICASSSAQPVAETPLKRFNSVDTILGAPPSAYGCCLWYRGRPTPGILILASLQGLATSNFYRATVNALQY